MSISIKTEKNDLVDPIGVWGSEHGTIWQQYCFGEPQNAYWIGCGPCENPIHIWWDDESKEYKLSSNTNHALKSFFDHVRAKKLPDASVSIVLKK